MKLTTSVKPAPEQTLIQPPGRLHLNYLDSLRALAATYVVLFHAHTQQASLPHLSHLMNQFFFLLSFGHYAVDVFIVLSGFCLMLPVARGNGTLRGGTLNFIKKRARRILPTYYLAFLLSLGLIFTLIGHKTGTAWDTALPADFKNIVLHLLLLQDLTLRSCFGINYALGSIAVEWRIYFLFPVLVLCWKRFGAFTTTFVTVLGSYVLFFALRYTPLHEVVNPTLIVGAMPQYLGLFAIGMLAAGIVFSQDERLQSIRTTLRWDWITIIGLAAVAILSIKKIFHGHVFPIAYTDLLVGLWAMSLLIWTSDSRNLLHRLLSWKPLVFVGTFAYSIYLIHTPLLQILWQYVWHPLGLSPLQIFAAQVLVGTPLIIAVSYVFYLCCERPFVNKPVGRTEVGNVPIGLSANRMPVS